MNQISSINNEQINFIEQISEEKNNLMSKLKMGLKKFLKADGFLIASVILIMAVFLFFRYCFLGFSYVFDDFGSDTIRINFPAYYSLFDKFKNGSLFYSLDMGIGNTFLAHTSIIFDPFTYILYIFGQRNIESMFIWYIIIKIVASGITLNFYLSHFKVNRYAKLIACILYAFNGFMIITGQNYVFSTIYIYLPLIFLSIELFLSKNKLMPFIIIQLLTVLYFYYFFYMTMIMTAVYYLIRYKSYNKFKVKKFTLDLLKLILACVLVLGLSAFFLLPNLYQTFSSIRGQNSTVSFSDLIIPSFSAFFTALGRLLSPDIFGEHSSYFGYSVDYYSLAIYGSILSLLLIPQLFKNSNKKTKKFIIFLILLILAVLIFSVFSFILNGFREITYRYVYIISFAMSVGVGFSIQSIFKEKKFSIKLLLYTALVIILFTVLFRIIYNFQAVYINTSINFDRIINLVDFSKINAFENIFPDIFYILIPLVLFCAVIFICYKFKIKNRIVLTAIIVLSIAAENFVVYNNWINNRTNIYNNMEANHIGYFDDSYDLINTISNLDKSAFRIEKNFDSVMVLDSKLQSDNDSMVQRYYGTKLYSSVNNGNYVKFLQDLDIFVCFPLADMTNKTPYDIKGPSLNYINGVGNRYDLLSYLGVKYYIVNNDEVLPDNFVLKEVYNDLKLYENINYYPLAFIQTEYIDYEEFMKLETNEKDLNLLQFAVLEKGIQTNAKKVSANRDLDNDLKSQIALKNRNEVEVSIIKDNKIKINAHTEENGLITFTIPYQDGWEVFCDGEKIDKFKSNLGLLSANIEAGDHEIIIVYKPEFIKAGTIISITSLLVLLFVCINSKYKIIKFKKNKKNDGEGDSNDD